MNPEWLKKHPILALLLALVFISIGIVLVNWWKARKSGTSA